MKILLLAGLLLTSAANPEFKIATTSPIVATGYTTSEAYVVGKDMKTRRCPAEYNAYIRVEGKNPDDKNLYYLPPKSMLTPSNGISYSIVCIKELP